MLLLFTMGSALARTQFVRQIDLPAHHHSNLAITDDDAIGDEPRGCYRGEIRWSPNPLTES